MKRIFLSIFPLLVISTTNAETILLSDEVKIKSHSSVWKKFKNRTTTINWHTESQRVDLSVQEDKAISGLSFNAQEVSDLLKVLDNYFLLRDKALTEQIELQEELNQLTVEQGFWQEQANSAINIAIEPTLTFTFFSRNKHKHELVISASQLQNDGDTNNHHQMASLYLEHTDIQELHSTLQQTFISQKMADHTKQKLKKSVTQQNKVISEE